MDDLLPLLICFGLPVLFLIAVISVPIAIIKALSSAAQSKKVNIFSPSKKQNPIYAGPESSKKVNISPPSKKQNPISEYLFQSSVKGIPESEAINRLLANGWSQEQINEAQVSNEASSPISLSTDP
ncbi:MAG: hypothetical protein GWP42_06685 [Verrucomicrobiales bacterium]|nr:hypothetical protein [Verrucomicrobiales bacterium]